jgi:Na+/glutamate symporter
LEITFDLDARDTLLLYFFTGIGLNARLSDLFRGGRPFFYSSGVVRRAGDEVLLAAEPAARFSRTTY